jgi:D-alanyl-D-alanine-carboxypeptidase/D-alanyl-D-alanine-endopeptidase
MRLPHTLLLVFSGWLAGCGGGSAAPPPASGSPPADPFAEVDRTASAAFAAQGIGGMGLVIYDAQGVKRFERYYGAFNGDQRVAIASASKMVAGLLVFRLIDQGYLSLDSTTGAVLGWAGPSGEITMRQLLSFTSGLQPNVPCTYVTLTTLEDCVENISQLPLVAAPGTRFDYGNSHLHVAARMAEVATGSSWAELFETQLKAPLGLSSSELRWYSAPRQALGTTNPLIAGGMRATMNEYARLLGLDFARGQYQGNRLIGEALFTAQATEPYPDAVIGNSPFASIALDFHYGLTAWLECPPPAANCAVLSSPGAFGFTPWFDRDEGYYAIIGMEVDEAQSGIVSFSVQLAQDLKPLIRAAL